MVSDRMPAEWEPHASTWIAWPHRLSDWPGKFVTIGWVYGEIARTLSRYEKVNIVVRDATQAAIVIRTLHRVGADIANIELHEIPTNRSWLRDSGPIFVEAAGQRTALDWRFNAWTKYPDWQLDDAIPAIVAGKLGLPTRQPMHGETRLVLEGGSIDVNGTGQLLTTEECLLSSIQERNPGLNRDDYERVFAEYLGVKEVIWLHRGIVGDDTHGHIDDIARFVNPTTIIAAVESNRDDENHAILQENWDRLRGGKCTVVELPMPSPLALSGQRLPASYANFYIANGVVIVPTFNDPNDRIALGIIADCFPDRDVIGIHSVDLVYGLGTLHCLTQQEPLGH